MSTINETSDRAIGETDANNFETLNKFLNDLYSRKVSFRISDGEASDIRQSVIQMISKLAKKIGSIDARLKIEEVVLVGSAGEGTQIIQPDEYDFLLTLELFSTPGALCFTNTCSGKDNYVHITLKDDKLKILLKDILQKDELRSTQNDRIFPPKNGLRQIFHDAVRQAMKAYSTGIVQTSTGTLHLHSCALELHGPAFTLKFKWNGQTLKNFCISVDLCPVIKLCGKYPEMMLLENVTCQTYYDYAQKAGSVMLLACKEGVSCPNGLCFSVILTETEMLLMKDLSEHHRKCYRILKYLVNAKQALSLPTWVDWLHSRVRPSTAFFSYALKILLLNHHYQQSCAEKNNFPHCIIKLILEIETILNANPFVIPGIPRRYWLSSPFFKTHNILGNHSLKLADTDLSLRLKLLLLHLLYINELKDYKFKDCLVSSVREMDTPIIAAHVTTATLLSIVCLYGYPELGHLTEDIFSFLVKKYLYIAKITVFMSGPVESKFRKSFLSSKKVNEKPGFFDPGIYFIAAVELSLLSLWLYPEFGHLVENMSTLLTWKYMDLSKRYEV